MTIINEQKILDKFGYPGKFWYHGVDILMAVRMELAKAYLYGYLDLSFSTLFNYFKRLFNLNKLIKELNKSNVLFTHYVKRQDHIDLVNLAAAGVRNARVLALESGSVDFRFNNVAIFQALKLFVKHHGFFRALSVRRKLILLIFAYRFIDVVDQLKRLDGKVDYNKIRYVPFASSQFIENIITQYLRIKGAKTYHLCHSFLFAPERNASFNYFNSRNIAAETVLAWGDSFVDQSRMLNFDSFRIRVAGNPKYSSKELNIKQSFRRVIVFLAISHFDEINQRLLVELTKLKGSFESISFKPHVLSNMLSEIEKFCVSHGFHYIDPTLKLSDLLTRGEFDCAVSHNSTTYFEAIYYNMISFRYAPGEVVDFGDFNDRFNTADELIDLVQYYKTYDSQKLKNELTGVLKRFLGMGIDGYDKIINEP